MKPRRRTDGQPGDESDMPGTSVLNLQSESPQRQSAAPDSPAQSRPSLSQTPSGSSSASLPQHRPFSTAAPPRTPSAINQSALTPPEESVPQSQHAKRPLSSMSSLTAPLDPRPPSFAPSESPLPFPPPPTSPEKRRRTSQQGGGEVAAAPGSAAFSSSIPSALPPAHIPSLALTSPASNHQPLLEELVETSKSRAASAWREGAVEIFFRDFSVEDLDLQIKIAESVLCDDHKAMIFCKMPVRLRQHWIKRLGELHQQAV